MSKNSTDDNQMDQAFQGQLREQTERLQEQVEKGNMVEALRLIGDLGQIREQQLYQEVGRLTRSLHEAIRNFHIDVHNQKQQEELSKIADASDRLGYVVELTNNAANKTLDLVEESMPLASKVKEEAQAIKADWLRLRRREMKPAEFRQLYARIDTFLEDLSRHADTVHGNLSDILMAQDYQDLTGQVIQKVTSLVKEVEDNLVNLVVMASNVDELTGVKHDLPEEDKNEEALKGHGPQMKKEEREDVVSGQDDVDDLLSSLGF
ncbi:protein phosphatase CheZ [Marinobacteraceae bacterium S3BR75-40.1]